MDLLLWNRAEFHRLYNCSMYAVDDLPIEKRRKIFLGIGMLVLFAISEVLYLPCLVAIWRNLQESCYKIMLFIGVTDVFALWVCAFQSGLFAITGAVFCSYPTLIYWSGMFGDMFWSLETSAATLLAANRCIVIALPHLGNLLFSGWRTWPWLVLIFAYSFWYGFFTNPILFSSVTFTWFFNPHVGYIDGIDGMYANNLDTIHSGVVACTIAGFYVLFLILLWAKRRNISDKGEQQQQLQAVTRMIFLQVFLLSLVNTICGVCYVLMALVEFPEWVGYLGNYMWAFCHGIPPVIYLSINRSIRSECARMVGLRGQHDTSNGGPMALNALSQQQRVGPANGMENNGTRAAN